MLFQVFLNRGLTPQQGQEYLRRMNDVAKNAPATGSPSTIKIPGVTRFDDPANNKPVFPDWLQRALREKAGLTYDAINLCYFKKYDTEDEAVAMMHWFDSNFRPWIGKIYFAQSAILNNLQARVMDEHADLAGSQSY